MKFLIDIIFIAIIVIAFLIGLKKGFAKQIISIAVFILALYLAFTFSKPVANFIGGRFVEPGIKKTMVEQIEKNANVTEILPEYIVKNAERIGLDVSSIQQLIFDEDNFSAEQIADNVISTSIRPILNKIISAVACAVLFAVLFFVLSLIARLFNHLIKASLFGGLNSILGGVLGGIKGAIICVIICLLLTAVLFFKSDGFLIFTPEALENSFIFGLVSKLL